GVWELLVGRVVLAAVGSGEQGDGGGGNGGSSPDREGRREGERHTLGLVCFGQPSCGAGGGGCAVGRRACRARQLGERQRLFVRGESQRQRVVRYRRVVPGILELDVGDFEPVAERRGKRAVVIDKAVGRE